MLNRSLPHNVININGHPYDILPICRNILWRIDETQCGSENVHAAGAESR